MAKIDFIHDRAPTRQGFYEVLVRVAGVETEHIAEWRAQDKKEGRRWWGYHSEDPTLEKLPYPLEGVFAWRNVAPARVASYLKRSQTRQELIEAAYQCYKADLRLYDVARFEVPAIRRLSVGDSVMVGNLKNVVVVDLRDEGEAVVVEYGPAHDSATQRGRALGCWHWLEVLPRQTTQPAPHSVSSPLRHLSQSQCTLDSLLTRMYRTDLHDNPEYQRGYVWTDEDKDLFLDAVFKGHDIGRFIFVRYAYPRPDELFDGKQRMHTLMEFITSRRPYRGLYWHELAQADRNHVDGLMVSVSQINGAVVSRADLLRIFLAVNTCGVPQSQEHLKFVQQLLDETLEETAE